MPATAEKTPLSPTALANSDAAQLLLRVGGERITADMLEEDISDAAPVNADGTLNLVHYAAWLVKELGRGD